MTGQKPALNFLDVPPEIQSLILEYLHPACMDCEDLSLINVACSCQSLREIAESLLLARTQLRTARALSILVSHLTERKAARIIDLEFSNSWTDSEDFDIQELFKKLFTLCQYHVTILSFDRMSEEHMNVLALILETERYDFRKLDQVCMDTLQWATNDPDFSIGTWDPISRFKSFISGLRQFFYAAPLGLTFTEEQLQILFESSIEALQLQVAITPDVALMILKYLHRWKHLKRLIIDYREMDQSPLMEFISGIWSTYYHFREKCNGLAERHGLDICHVVLAEPEEILSLQDLHGSTYPASQVLQWYICGFPFWKRAFELFPEFSDIEISQSFDLILDNREAINIESLCLLIPFAARFVRPALNMIPELKIITLSCHDHARTVDEIHTLDTLFLEICQTWDLVALTLELQVPSISTDGLWTGIQSIKSNLEDVLLDVDSLYQGSLLSPSEMFNPQPEIITNLLCILSQCENLKLLEMTGGYLDAKEHGRPLEEFLAIMKRRGLRSWTWQIRSFRGEDEEWLIPGEDCTRMIAKCAEFFKRFADPIVEWNIQPILAYEQTLPAQMIEALEIVH
ncbi:hypothetical protein NEOLI_002795 [Neolecta irregularis DAH-3]|uniref:F-box domain-containing protein n=1 Tax=Neolecta irregularis (strain DAH-3) TaxID=1198029 RepID=A0A1U7LGD6_NEOID|nr:hypothetical protein NEOLI_002795 [Neolecta irregularis DAH-3]|eukprot:OLL21709.1 hypothetical protein NEOLI_002795 [Neolecta irregularis DAH-3]